MRRNVVLLTVVSWAAYALASLAASADWIPVAAKLGKSLVYLEASGGSCTGFVSDSDVQRDGKSIGRNYVITAAHCDGKELFAAGATARVIFKDTKKDLLVIETDRLNKPALQLAQDNPRIGEEVASYGFGWALERPMFRTAHIADDDTYIPEDGIGGPLIVTDALFVSGQSGGPVVNAAGDVVLIVQRGGGGVGVGVGAKVLRDKVGRYFEKVKP